MIDIEKAYLAGILDGEGSISIRRARWQYKKVTVTGHTRVAITNTNEDLIKWIVKTTGYGKTIIRQPLDHCRTQYHWVVGRREAILELLEQLEPFLIVKKEFAKKAMEFIRSRMKKHLNTRYDNKEIELISWFNKHSKFRFRPTPLSSLPIHSGKKGKGKYYEKEFSYVEGKEIA